MLGPEFGLGLGLGLRLGIGLQFPSSYRPNITAVFALSETAQVFSI